MGLVSDRRPNLFSYGKKELSQDAMICWLIAWSTVETADDSESLLRKCGEAFVEALLRKHDQELAGPITRASIYQQDKGIDVLALVEDRNKRRHVLLIEDKTHTGEHSGQLRRYLDHVRNGETNVGKAKEDWDLLHPIYLKTGNQSLANDKKIEKSASAYRVFRRDEFLRVLETYPYPGNNPILADFRQYLKDREDDFLSFRNWREDRGGEWSWAGWEGFFRHLEDPDFLGDGDWSYVSNPSGGFLGYWWGGIPDQEAEARTKVYQQLEINPGRPSRYRLCFKVSTASKDREALKRKWHTRIMEAGRFAGIEIHRPARMRISNTMTVAEWNSWLRFDGGRLDVRRTVESLRLAEGIVRKAAKP